MVPFLEVTAEEFQRIIDINLMGVVYGTRAALEIFTKQGQGTIINISSILGAVPDPYESAYVTSKFAIRGFTASIRQEVRLTGLKDVHVCTVLPATMDTPIYLNGANRSGKTPRAIPPVYPAELVADAIVGLIARPRAETIVGGGVKVLALLYRMFPSLVEPLFARYIKLFHFKDVDTADTSGNLFQQSARHAERGGWPTVPKNTDKLVSLTIVVAIFYVLVRIITRGK